MLHVETNQLNTQFTSPIKSNEPDSSIELRPRLCILHKWPHYDGIQLEIFRHFSFDQIRTEKDSF